MSAPLRKKEFLVSGIGRKEALPSDPPPSTAGESENPWMDSLGHRGSDGNDKVVLVELPSSSLSKINSVLASQSPAASSAQQPASSRILGKPLTAAPSSKKSNGNGSSNQINVKADIAVEKVAEKGATEKGTIVKQQKRKPLLMQSSQVCRS